MHLFSEEIWTDDVITSTIQASNIWSDDRGTRSRWVSEWEGDGGAWHVRSLGFFHVYDRDYEKTGHNDVVRLSERGKKETIFLLSRILHGTRLNEGVYLPLSLSHLCEIQQQFDYFFFSSLSFSSIGRVCCAGWIESQNCSFYHTAVIREVDGDLFAKKKKRNKKRRRGRTVDGLARMPIDVMSTTTTTK